MIDDFKWLRMGVSVIDAEHQQFLKFVKVIASADNHKCSNLYNKEFLENMLRLLQKHSRHEEELMFATDYQELNSHIIAHTESMVQLQNIIDW